MTEAQILFVSLVGRVLMSPEIHPAPLGVLSRPAAPGEGELDECSLV